MLRRLRTYFLTGLVVGAPIAITIYHHHTSIIAFTASLTIAISSLLMDEWRLC